MSSPSPSSPSLPDIMSTCQHPRQLSLNEASGRGGGVVISSAYFSSLSGKGFYEARDQIADKLSIALQDLQDDNNAESIQITSYAIGCAVSLAEATPTTDSSSAHDTQKLAERLEGEREEGEVVIALSAVTSNDIPQSRRQSIDLTEYSQALCTQLIHLIRIVTGDTRLHRTIRNSSPSSSPNNEIRRASDDTDTRIIFVSLTLS